MSINSLKSGKVRLQSANYDDVALTFDENQKFNLFYFVLFKSIEQMREKDSFRANQGNTFLDWFINKTKQKKDLVCAFTRVYDFLEDSRQKHANEMTLEEYVIDSIEHGKNEFAED